MYWYVVRGKCCNQGYQGVSITHNTTRQIISAGTLMGLPPPPPLPNQLCRSGYCLPNISYIIKQWQQPPIPPPCGHYNKTTYPNKHTPTRAFPASPPPLCTPPPHTHRVPIHTKRWNRMAFYYTCPLSNMRKHT